MAQPPVYAPVHEFLSDVANLPSFPGQSIDIELAAIAAAFAAYRTNLGLIQRNDGALANGVVTYDSLAPTLQTAGIQPLTPWVTGTLYQPTQAILFGSSLYQCVTQHTSGTFSVDLAAGDWTFLADLAILSGTATAAANKIAAGPISGSPATPAFRSLVVADLPTAIPNANLANTSITLGSTTIALGATAATLAGLTLTTVTLASPIFTGTVAGAGTIPSSVLANTAVTPTSYGSSTSIPSFTVNAQGQLTAAAGNVVIAPAGTLTGTALAAAVVASSLTSVGTLTGGATGVGFTVALSTSTVTGTLPAANHPALTGDVTNTVGTVATVIAANAVTNAKAAQMAAFTVKGNATGSTANATDISIPALTQKVSPVAGDMVMIVDSAASNALKYALVSALASAGSVSSIALNTGSFTLSGLLTNSVNDLRVTAASKSDQTTSTSNIVAVTPLHQQDHPSAAKAWAMWNGATTGTNAPSAGYNVSSVTRNSIGNYSVTFSTNFATANYVAIGIVTRSTTSGSGTSVGVLSTNVGSVVIDTRDNSNTLQDPASVYIVCYGAQ